MISRASRSVSTSCWVFLTLLALMSATAVAQESEEDVKRQSLAQRISALSSSMKQKLGHTFGRSDSDVEEAHNANCKCCQAAVDSPQTDLPAEGTRPIPLRMDYLNGQTSHQSADQRAMNQHAGDQNVSTQTLVPRRRSPSSSPSNWEGPAKPALTISDAHASHSPIHISKHHPTETAEFREILNGDSQTEKAAFYDDGFVGDFDPNSDRAYRSGQNHNAGQSHSGFQHEQYHHAFPTDAGASRANPALPNPVLAQQNADSNRYSVPSPPGGQMPPYEGYRLGNRQITATEHALFLKSENETLKASQRALLAEKERLKETVRLNQEMIAKSEKAMSHATEQLKAADRQNLEWERKYAALQQEHERFVKETDRTLDSIRNDLDEVLVSEINATR